MSSSPALHPATMSPRWTDVRSTWRSVDDERLHVLTAAQAGDGPPHLLLHGLGASSNSWIEVIGDLSGRGEVVAPDLPGFGRSQPSPDHDVNVDTAIDAAAALLDDLGWDKAIVHGNSMGGLIAALLAARHPDRVAGLVLASPALPPAYRTVWPPTKMMTTLLPALLLPGIGESLLALLAKRDAPLVAEENALMTATFADPSLLATPEMVALYEGEAELFSKDWRRRSLLSMTRSITWHSVRPGVWKQLATIDVPTSVLWGEEDGLLPLGMLRTIEDRRPDWNVEILPGVAHVPPIEAPESYLATTDDLLSSLPKSSRGRSVR